MDGIAGIASMFHCMPAHAVSICVVFLLNLSMEAREIFEEPTESVSYSSSILHCRRFRANEELFRCFIGVDCSDVWRVFSGNFKYFAPLFFRSPMQVPPVWRHVGIN